MVNTQNLKGIRKNVSKFLKKRKILTRKVLKQKCLKLSQVKFATKKTKRCLNALLKTHAQR